MASPTHGDASSSVGPAQPPGISATPGEAVEVSNSPIDQGADAEQPTTQQTPQQTAQPTAPALPEDPLRAADPWARDERGELVRQGAQARASSAPRMVFRGRKWQTPEAVPKVTSFALNTPEADDARRRLDMGKAADKEKTPDTGTAKGGVADLKDFPNRAEAAATARAEATEVAMASILQMVANLQETITELKKEKEALVDKAGVDDKLPMVHHKDLDKPNKFDGKEWPSWNDSFRIS